MRLLVTLLVTASLAACAAPPQTAQAPLPAPAPVVAAPAAPTPAPEVIAPPPPAPQIVEARPPEAMPALPPPRVGVVDADPEPPAARYPLPAPLATTQTNMPLDAVRVAAAIIDRLSGGTGLAAGVLFSDEAGAKVDASRSALPGLDWRDSKLLQYAPVEYTPRVAPQGRVAAGQLEFADELDRRATILFSVEYSLADEPIAVLNIEIAPIFALDPDVALFLVDAADVPDAAGLVAASHADLLRLALDKGVRWRSSPAEGTRDWMIFAFLMERVSPSSRLRLGVTDQPQTAALYDATARVLDDGGWRVAVMPGRFSLFDAGLWARAEFAPGAETGPEDRRLRTIGLFPLSVTTARADVAR
jgi:hypothetical protein